MGLEFVVWQFVRIMVRLEEQASQSGAAAMSKLYQTWRGAWEELDARLDELGQTDAAAYADLMMDQEIILDGVPADQMDALAAVVRSIIDQLADETAKARVSGGESGGNADAATDLESLEFELREMEDLMARLRRLGGEVQGGKLH